MKVVSFFVEVLVATLLVEQIKYSNLDYFNALSEYFAKATC